MGITPFPQPKNSGTGLKTKRPQTDSTCKLFECEEEISMCQTIKAASLSSSLVSLTLSGLIIEMFCQNELLPNSPASFARK